MQRSLVRSSTLTTLLALGCSPATMGIGEIPDDDTATGDAATGGATTADATGEPTDGGDDNADDDGPSMELCEGEAFHYSVEVQPPLPSSIAAADTFACTVVAAGDSLTPTLDCPGIDQTPHAFAFQGAGKGLVEEQVVELQLWPSNDGAMPSGVSIRDQASGRLLVLAIQAQTPSLAGAPTVAFEVVADEIGCAAIPCAEGEGTFTTMAIDFVAGEGQQGGAWPDGDSYAAHDWIITWAPRASRRVEPSGTRTPSPRTSSRARS